MISLFGLFLEPSGRCQTRDQGYGFVHFKKNRFVAISSQEVAQMAQDGAKMSPRWPLDDSREPLGGLSGGSWGLLGASWGPLGGILGLPREVPSARLR